MFLFFEGGDGLDCKKEAVKILQVLIIKEALRENWERVVDLAENADSYVEVLVRALQTQSRDDLINKIMLE